VKSTHRQATYIPHAHTNVLATHKQDDKDSNALGFISGGRHKPFVRPMYPEHMYDEDRKPLDDVYWHDHGAYGVHGAGADHEVAENEIYGYYNPWVYGIDDEYYADHPHYVHDVHNIAEDIYGIHNLVGDLDGDAGLGLDNATENATGYTYAVYDHHKARVISKPNDDFYYPHVMGHRPSVPVHSWVSDDHDESDTVYDPKGLMGFEPAAYVWGWQDGKRALTRRFYPLDDMSSYHTGYRHDTGALVFFWGVLCGQVWPLFCPCADLSLSLSHQVHVSLFL
jgi:hypothetical protein